VVNGDPVAMRRGDFLPQAGWNRHGHQNVSDRPTAWIGALGIPFAHYTGSTFFEFGPTRSTTRPPRATRTASRQEGRRLPLGDPPVFDALHQHRVRVGRAGACGSPPSVGRRDPSGPEQRAAEIEAGSRLPATEFRSSVRASAAHLTADLQARADEMWAHDVVTAQGRAVPATGIPMMRTREVAVHAVDLGSGVDFEDLPEELTAAPTVAPPGAVLLAGVPARLSRSVGASSVPTTA
jgi:Mycothiol maleylpyruvate isomerase N-terminal domain